MALQLILGGSGQGKTEYLMQEVVRESLAHPSRRFYVLVPEQFSLEMQRQMLERHPRHAFSNIDILSFHRLAYRVFDECGYQPARILEDLGVVMILKKVLMEHQEDLIFFRPSFRLPGFLDEMKSMLMEFINYGVTPSGLEEVCGSLEDYPGLKNKCQELSKIYFWFNESIRDHFMVAGQILDVLKDLVPSSKMLEEGIFYLDGYTGFTPIQLDFLEELLPRAREVKVTVTIPYLPDGKRRYPREDLFAFSEQTIYSLWDLCAKKNIEILDPVILDRAVPPRYGEGRELAHLESNMFRRIKKVWSEEPETIHMVSCPDPDSEAEFILLKIEELVRRRGYRYRDFAVLMGNEEDYPPAFIRKSRMLNIPLFVDTKKKMNYHSGAETIRSLFHLARMDYSYESVFRYLKSGMSGLSMEDVDYLENYIISSGVRGLSMWSRPFIRRLQDYSPEQVEKLEELRVAFLAETRSFARKIRDRETTVKEKITVLYETLRDLHLKDKLLEKADEADREEDYEKGKGYRQFYGNILDLMDKIVAIFGEEIMEEKELFSLLDAGLENLTLASPPLSMDQVILGDLKRTRLPGIKVLFFAGMNDGDIPPVPEDQGILTDEDKRILEKQGMTLSLDLTGRVLEDEFYMYLAFSKPEEELYLSCCETGAGGEARSPSILFNSLKGLYPRISMKKYPDRFRRYYFSEGDSREYLIRCMRSWYEGRKPEDPAFYALFSYWKEEHPRDLEDIFTWMEKDLSRLPLPPDLVDELYGNKLEGSVTKMERFASCPFLFFCQYGLGLTERQEFKVAPIELGNLFHAALEYFSLKIREMGLSWSDLSEENTDSLLEEAVSSVMEEKIRDVIESSARNQYKKRMIRRILARTVEVLSRHLRKSSFEPDRFELKFGPGNDLNTTRIPLDDGREIAFRGVIDRVDICEEDDKLFLRIIDYKTGAKNFDFNALYYGLQLQLIIYLDAALEIYANEKHKKVEPAGIFYYRIQDPIQKASDVSADKLMNVFRMSGYANSDPEILRLLEDGQGSMESFDLTLNKDGSPRKGSHVMDTLHFEQVGEYVRHTVKRMGERIFAGEIAASPYFLDKKDPCSYCAYASVCGFEEGRPGHEYRVLPKCKDELILEKIGEEVD